MRNRHLSVLMLYVRGAVAPLIGIIGLMAAVQTGAFLWSMQAAAEPLEAVVKSAHWKLIFCAGILLLAVMLLRSTSGGGYTVRRLRVSERAAFRWHSLACLGCIVLLWMSEVLILTLLCRYFVSVTGSSNKALFIAFYRSDFLHSILPLEEISRWIYLLTALLALSFCIANAVVRMRYRHGARTLLALLILLIGFIQRPLGSYASDVFLTLSHLCFIAYAIWAVWYHAEEVPSDDTN